MIRKDKEDYTWFVFHTALLNLFLGIIIEITYFYDNEEFYTWIDFAINQAVNSIFPLAFTRFFYLYFPYIY
uniref:Uncharacterized protein n=1 Tax=Acrobeloides nanus TaxID=290746 RepID=A0A914CGH5_9BILA